MKNYLSRVAGAFSRLLNVVVFNGHPSEALSARVYRVTLQRPTSRSAKWGRKIIDKLIFWEPNHTMHAHYRDMKYATERLNQGVTK